eukprot:44959-Eustigmatos_ZCMA.PRE.1
MWLPQGRVAGGEASALALRRCVDVLQEGGRFSRQGHLGDLSCAPIRQGAACTPHCLLISLDFSSSICL